ncbi:MAG: AAA family ATPase [Ruminococcus sp.]|nr:AAA family ATPase [Ruminococcus sp.]
MKVLILDRNAEYTQRFQYYMNKKNPDLQISACDSTDAAKSLMENERFDVILVDSQFDELGKEDIEKISDDTAFAYISDNNEIIRETETIFKYRTISVLYSRICMIYEKKKNRVVKKAGVIEKADKKTDIITFLPVHGGAGSSTVAAAAAVALSKEHEVLYLDLEQQTTDAAFFDSDNHRTITDFVSLLQTKYSDNSVYQLLRDIISKDRKQKSDKLSYIKGFANVLESSSMTKNCLKTLLEVLSNKFDYEYIIVDADFDASSILEDLIGASDKVVFVSTDSDIAAMKMAGVRRYLELLERESSIVVPEHYIIFNQYIGLQDESKVVGKIKVLTRFTRYRMANNAKITSQQIIDEMLKNEELLKIGERVEVAESA